MIKKISPNLILAIVGVAQLMDVLDMAIVNVALPSIYRELHFTSLGTLQWVASAYVLAYGGFLVLGGRLADIVGKKRMFVIATACFTLASVLTGTSQSDTALIFARGLQGLSAAFMSPAALSIVLTAFKEGKERNRALGLWGAIGMGGAVLGAVVGGLLTTYASWRWNFYINLFIGIGVLAFAVKYIPKDNRVVARQRPDIPGAALVTGGLMSLVYALSQAPTNGWNALSTRLTLGAAIIALVGFVINERYTRQPLVPLSIFKIKNIGAANLVYLANTAAFSSIFFFPTLYMQNLLHFTPLQTGLAFLPTAIFVAIAALSVSRLIVKIGYKLPMIIGLLVSILGLDLMTKLPVHGTYPSNLLPGFIAIGLGVGLTIVSATIAATNGVPQDKAGLASGLLNTEQQLGMALGLAIFSGIATASTTKYLANHANTTQALTAAQVHGYQAAFSTALLVVLGCIVIAFFGIRQSRDTTQATWKFKFHG